VTDGDKIRLVLNIHIIYVLIKAAFLTGMRNNAWWDMTAYQDMSCHRRGVADQLDTHSRTLHGCSDIWTGTQRFVGHIRLHLWQTQSQSGVILGMSKLRLNLHIWITCVCGSLLTSGNVKQWLII